MHGRGGFKRRIEAWTHAISLKIQHFLWTKWHCSEGYLIHWDILVNFKNQRISINCLYQKKKRINQLCFNPNKLVSFYSTPFRSISFQCQIICLLSQIKGSLYRKKNTSFQSASWEILGYVDEFQRILGIRFYNIKAGMYKDAFGILFHLFCTCSTHLYVVWCIRSSVHKVSLLNSIIT